MTTKSCMPYIFVVVLKQTNTHSIFKLDLCYFIFYPVHYQKLHTDNSVTSKYSIAIVRFVIAIRYLPTITTGRNYFFLLLY